jgi:hypothetical protein
MLIQEKFLLIFAEWILQNWKAVLESGPEIYRKFFQWLRLPARKKYGKWFYCSEDDWIILEAELKQFTRNASQEA